MSSFIPKTLKYLNSNFENDWLNDYLGDNDSISESNKSLILSKVNDLLKNTIDLFFKSLISGEYILDTKKIINEIDELNAESNILLNPITIDNSDSQEFLLNVLKGEYIDILKIYSNIYLNFIKLVQSQNENPNIDIVYEANFDTIRFFNKVSSHAERHTIKLFNLIVFIYRIDHFFNDDVSTYSSINQLENSIKEHQNSKYFVPIKEKLNFLKFKWEIRQKSYKKRNFKSTKAYIIDDELFISTDNVKYNPSLNKLKKWKEFIECYYELDDWESRLNNITNEFKHKEPEKLSTLELIFLLKGFKDVNKDYENLKDIVKEFKKRYVENCSTENRFLHNKTYLYALNNQFSALLEKDNIKGSSIKNLKIEIEKIQNKCNIDNFFIESKYINYKLNELSNVVNNREELANLSIYKKDLDHLTKSVNLYKKKLNWSKNNHNLLFQLPYNECVIKSNIDDLNIHYASSIVLPLPHQESQDNYEKINDKLKELKQLILSVDSLNKEFTIIKGLKNEIKTNQIKTLETIGVFTAIIAFILASIPSFSFVKEFYQALLFTGIIGSSLFLMVSLIFLFTRGFKKINSWILICLSVIIFCFTVFNLKSSINKVEKDMQIKYTKKIDSLKIKNNKLNTIFKKLGNKNNPASKKQK